MGVRKGMVLMGKASKVRPKQVGILSDFEQHIYRKVNKGKADQLKESKMIQEALKRALGIEHEVVLDGGERVVVSTIDMVVAKTLKDVLENPTTSKLKDLSAISGEQKTTLDVSVRGAKELFGDIVIDDDWDI